MDDAKAEPGAGRGIDAAFLDRFNFLDRTGALGALESLREENRVLDSLLNDAARIYTLRSIEDMLHFVVDRMLERLIPTKLLILLEPPRGRRLEQRSYTNLKRDDDRLPEEAYRALAERFAGSPYPAPYDALVLPPELRAELARFNPAILLPLCGIEGVYGIVVIGDKALGGSYTEVERMYIDKLTRFVSIGIQNTLYHESAITDAKTGLYNNSYFMQRLSQEVAHVVRHDARAGVIMIDVDHFKRFNDAWGHLAGDEVLAALARALKRAVRAEDVASRFGGEEFSVLAIDCDGPTLLEMAERIRLEVAAMSVPYKGDSLSVTASLGCCVIDRELRAGASEYIDMADKALYQSKRDGRNRSTLYRIGLLDRASLLRRASTD